MVELRELLTDVVEQQRKQGEQLDALAKRVETRDKVKPSDVFGVPHIRKGEDPLSSRGYSFIKAVGYVAGALNASEAKVEIDVHNKLQSSLTRNTSYEKAVPNSFLVPFSTAHTPLVDRDDGLLAEVRSLVLAGVHGVDQEELIALRSRYRQKALSWLDTTEGGALVAPPVMGEMIELLRNNECLLQAGARDIGMPPNGRITFPRQTGATTAYWVGENTTITESNPTFGDLVLTAKKLGVLCKIPNELMRFSTISAEQMIREDIARVLALRIDKTLIDGPGSSVAPKGLLHYSGITTHIAATTAANGDTFEPEDVYDMIGKVEEQNATFKAWIMRPRMYGKIRNRRADAVTAGDKKGPFLFDMFRSGTDGMELGRGTSNLGGYPVVKSNQVPNNRTKGTSTNLTCIIGGDFSDFIIAMAGVIEFMVSTQGDTMIEKDQTWIRGIQYVDAGVRREASFVVCDKLLVA